MIVAHPSEIFDSSQIVVRRMFPFPWCMLLHLSVAEEYLPKMTEVEDSFPRHQQVVTRNVFPSCAYQMDRLYRSIDRDVVDLAPYSEVVTTDPVDSVVFALLAYLDCDLVEEE